MVSSDRTNNQFGIWLQTIVPDEISTASLLKDLSALGADSWRDFLDLSCEEALLIWPPLQQLPQACVVNLLASAKMQQRQSQRVKPVESEPSNSAGVASIVRCPEVSNIPTSEVTAVLSALTECREQMRLPSEIASLLRRSSKINETSAGARWLELHGRIPPELPAQRAMWLAELPADTRTKVSQLLAEDSLWTELQAWHASAPHYASAVELWGMAAKIAKVNLWPPVSKTLNTFVFLFCRAVTFQMYSSRIRSVLRLLRADFGVLDDISAVLTGAEKRFRHATKVKVRATADQTRDLATHMRDEFGREDLADSIVVARQFCLRYKAEVLGMEGQGALRSLEFSQAQDGRLCASYLLKDRKLQSEPVVVVRNCICQLQGRRLCGVCVLKRRFTPGKLFDTISYVDALAMFMAAAIDLKLPDAECWGTHAFRRGWAADALKEGGPKALFFSGGWKGVAAFGYAEAQTKGALAAAEWLVDHSSSDDNEQYLIMNYSHLHEHLSTHAL